MTVIMMITLKFKSTGLRPLTALALTCVLAVFVLLGTVHADTVRTGGFTYDDLTVEAVTDGNLIYTSPTGAEVKLALDKVEWVKLDRLPEFGAGEDARLENKLDEAIKQYRSAAQRAQTDWAKQLSQLRLYQTAVKAEKAAPALRAYLALAQMDTSPAMLGDPPVAMVTLLDENQRGLMVQNARRAFAQADAAKRQQIQKLLDAAIALEQGKEVKVAPPSPTESAEDADFGAALKPLGLILYSRAKEPGVTELISAGDFSQAASKAKESMRDPRGLPMKLYLLGMAQLGMAEQSNQPEDYMDAAISFIRVPIHYQKHSFRIPCLVEAAYCHLQIDRPDIASKLLDEAEEELDESEYPEYTQRIDALREKIQESVSSP